MISIILAGGFATRLWPLTENRAKPLLHVKDRPLISHIVDGLPADMEIIVSTNAVFENAFKEWLKDYPNRNIRIFVEDSTSDEVKKGALGAVSYAIERLGINDDVLLMAGDNYFGFRIMDFINFYKGNPLLAAYDIKERERARQFGVVVAKDGRVTEFQEKPAEPKSTLVSTGCYIFPKANLSDISEYSKKHNDDLGGVFEFLLSKGSVIDVFTFAEPWYDIGSFNAYLKANRELLGGRQIIEPGATVTGSKVSGGVYIGRDSVVIKSTLEDVVILKNCRVENCVIRNCVVDEESALRNIDLTHQMIRHGSVIEK